MKNRGFTLIELMIVVAIIGVLAAIAYPGYQNYIRKAKRSDAKAALTAVQLKQEKWRGSHTTYANAPGTLGLSTSSTDGNYTISISDATGTGYTATATAKTGTTQANDSGCTEMTVTISTANPNGAYSPTGCW